MNVVTLTKGNQLQINTFTFERAVIFGIGFCDAQGATRSSLTNRAVCVNIGSKSGEGHGGDHRRSYDTSKQFLEFHVDSS